MRMRQNTQTQPAALRILDSPAIGIMTPPRIRVQNRYINTGSIHRNTLHNRRLRKDRPTGKD